MDSNLFYCEKHPANVPFSILVTGRTGMDLLQIFNLFPDQKACFQHLENLRYGDTPYCPHCKSTYVARKSDSKRIGRWNCYNCNSSFNVLSGTIFAKTRVPLQKWFVAIDLIVNSKKSLSSGQLARMLFLTQPTALHMRNRIQTEMAKKQSAINLQFIIQGDETHAEHKFGN